MWFKITSTKANKPLRITFCIIKSESQGSKMYIFRSEATVCLEMSIRLTVLSTLLSQYFRIVLLKASLLIDVGILVYFLFMMQ